MQTSFQNLYRDIHKTLSKDYFGFVHEGILYTTYPFRPKRPPLKKFAIFSYRRTGSKLLVTLLDSHPQTHCDGEILFYRRAFPKRYLDYHANLMLKEVYGFKLQVPHFENHRLGDPDQFMAQLCDSGFKIIKLKRHNIFLTALSLIRAKSTGQFHIKKSEKGTDSHKIVIDLEELLATLQLVERDKALLDQIAGKVPHIEFSYEDDLLTPERQQATVDQISDYLGISPAKVSTNLVKGSSNDFSDFVANADEVRTYIGATRYAEFLDM